VIWAVLALLGVPLWLCAIAIIAIVLRNRSLRRRRGDVPVRVRRAGKRRWIRGHGTWVHDVFAFRGSPAAWHEHLLWVQSAVLVPVNDVDQKKLRHLGPGCVIARFHHPDGEPVEFATRAEHTTALLGSTTTSATPVLPPRVAQTQVTEETT
jgi:hypothetical protein